MGRERREKELSQVRIVLLVGSLAMGLLTWRPALAGAQTVTDPLEHPSEPVGDVIETTEEAINETTAAVTQAVENGASSTADTDTGIDESAVTSDGSGSSGSGAVGSDGATSNPPGGGPVTAGRGSGRTTASVETEGRPDSRSAAAHDRQVGIEFGPSFLVSPLIVSKTNDANGNGVFSDSEASPRPGAAVSFLVKITNSGDVDLTITDVRDAFEGGFWGVDLRVCKSLFGDPLPAKASISCSFTLKNYAPERGRKVNTLHVNSVETADPSTRVIGGDTSTVLGPNVAVLGKVTTSPLATTGAQVVALLNAMCSLIIVGALLVATGRLRKEAILASTRIGGEPS